MSYSPYEQPSAAPPPLAYMTPIEATKNDSHIKTLAICHYVWGALAIVGSSCFIIYIVIGVMAITGAMASSPPSPNDLDGEVGWFFVLLGSLAVLLGWSIGILNIVSGVSMMKRRRRTLSLILAGFNCLSVPLGTTLGVFTFVVLLRDTVVAEYNAAAMQPQWPI